MSVAESNCVAERRGGEQLEAKSQSINKTKLKPIRPDAWASQLANGEAKKRNPRPRGTGNPAAVLRSTVSVTTDVHWVIGYGMAGSRCDVNQGSRSGKRTEFMAASGPKSRPEGDRVPIVVKKRGNARGAKGGRKLTVKRVADGDEHTAVVPGDGLFAAGRKPLWKRTSRRTQHPVMGSACKQGLSWGHVCLGSDRNGPQGASQQISNWKAGCGKSARPVWEGGRR